MLTDMKSMKGNNFVWTTIDTPAMEALTPLLDSYPFHSLDIEDCLSKTQLPKIEEYSEYLFMILHFQRFLKEKKFSIPVQVSMFISTASQHSQPPPYSTAVQAGSP